ncbi:MAG: hypothetical protein IJ188_03925 [Clostridia bacterium]|nr:hypothetical protein [Clostridia bacterium]
MKYFRKSLLLLLAGILLLSISAFGMASATDALSPREITAVELIDLLYGNTDSNYIGEIIRVEGFFSPETYEMEGLPYYDLVIVEPNSCCAEAVPYTMNPDITEFPAYGTPIQLIGTLEEVEVDGEFSVRIQNAIISWEQAL